MNGDKREENIEKNLPLVHSLANRFRGRGIEYEELYSAGCLGLVKAYDNFDEDRGVQFSTYAVPVILGEIRRLFREGGAVKMSRSLKELSLRASRERDRLISEGLEPRISDIAKRLGISFEEASEAICAGIPPVSLTSDRDDEETELEIPQDSGEEAIINRLALKQCLSELNDEEKKIITLRYFRSKTQCETAEILGLSQVTVSRREKKILENMREKLLI